MPVATQVGCFVTVPLFHLWSRVRGIASVFVSPQPGLVHLKVLTPSVQQIGWVVTVPLSHVWLVHFSVVKCPSTDTTSPRCAVTESR